MSDESSSNATASADSGHDSIFGPMHLTRLMIAIMAVVFAFVFWYAAEWLHWPKELGFGGSLAQSPMALGAFVAMLILLVICTFVGTRILGRRWFLAGLMAATAGLATWSVRGGSMTQVLFNAENNGTHGKIFLQMVGELIVLFGVIGGLWNMIWNASGRSITGGEISAEDRAIQAGKLLRVRKLAIFGIAALAVGAAVRAAGGESDEKEGRSTSTALLAQTLLMAVLFLLLAVTPLKKQVLTCVFLAGLVSTAVAEATLSERGTGRWYWIAPLIVGAVGYLVAYFNPAGMETGDLQGTFAPLARVLPLDFASLGCAGVLFGYWWMEPDADELTDSSEGENSAPASESKAA